MASPCVVSECDLTQMISREARVHSVTRSGAIGHNASTRPDARMLWPQGAALRQSRLDRAWDFSLP